MHQHQHLVPIGKRGYRMTEQQVHDLIGAINGVAVSIDDAATVLETITSLLETISDNLAKKKEG